jgi:chorismate mutase/prephenate dehydrogenase
MTEEMTRSRPLAALRAIIDAIDRDILMLFARRMAIVGEVASHKRQNAKRIRDLTREREVLGDRTSRAERLGLPGGTIESIFRLVLVASRDYQASLRAELPLEIEPRTVAIVGGEGGMGRRLAEMFGDLGHAVMVSDVGTSLTNVEAAKAADVVVVSVPIDVTDAVIREVGPHVRQGALLMDVTSVKTTAVAAMLEATEASGASVVGTHPMFGPGVHTLSGQRVVLVKGRGDEWYEWVSSMLSARGMVVTETTAERHDEAMAIVQVLNHFHTQVLGLALARMGTPLDETLRFTSPAYLLEMYVTARHFAQAPSLYAEIEMRNPKNAEVMRAFSDAAAELSEIVSTKDRERFTAVFDEVRGYFGEFTEEALDQSRFLIDRLIELTAGRSGAGATGD